MKKCPKCAEEIQEAAVKCKHCGHDLVPVAPPDTGPAVIIGTISGALVGGLGGFVLNASFGSFRGPGPMGPILVGLFLGGIGGLVLAKWLSTSR